ncbi:MAG: hypothetical protein PHW35_14120, partial [Lentimicrobiaceae bacterium]|nr:hypothetical protein [Lentimicrobiaceae bacterium]
LTLPSPQGEGLASYKGKTTLFCRKCDNEARLSSLSFEERAGGEVLLAGIYVWVITYADYLGKVSTLRGSVTVVR